MKPEDMVAVIQAHIRGEAIQSKSLGAAFWRECTSPIWDFYNNEYRIKPKPREFWVAGSFVYPNKKSAEFHQPHSGEPIHVREVID